jgi:NAD(P)-dependent dehydrogenase (short-subunit alcohol dehydrogenase family)
MSITSSTRVVVLGGTSGIGLAVARLAAERGGQVIVGSRNPASVSRALDTLPSGTSGHAVDVSSTEALTAFFERVGTFDHLVYTASDPLQPISLADCTVAKGEAFFSLRIVHALDAVRLAVPHLGPAGSIVLTSGTAAYKGGPGWVLGCAASGAMVSVGRSLAVELAPLRVNVVAPGVVRSPLWSAMSEEDQQAMYDEVGRSVPLGRVGEVEDAALAYVSLLEQDYVTGTVSVVDGGTLVA